MMGLTSEQIQLFRHNGFLKLPTRLPEETVTGLKETILRHIEERIEPIVRDGQGRVVRISALWDRDPLFREVFSSPLVLDSLESLLGADIEYVKNRHNHATLRLAGEGGNGFHRDTLQWSRNVLTILFYLEDTNPENGCTQVIPGSHLFPGLTAIHFNNAEWNQEKNVLDQALPVPMPAGGMLAIDSLLLHAAGENHTDRTRMSMTVGYHSVDELARTENPARALVRGQRRYIGNDK